MKHLPLAILLFGLSCIVLSPLSCRLVRSGLISSSESSDPIFASEYEADTHTLKESKQFLALLGIGFFLFGLGDYLRGRTKASNAVDRAMLHFRYCSKCGRPLRGRDCQKKRQLGFIPRLTCPGCGGFAEWSSAVIFAFSFVFLISPFLVGAKFGKSPDLLLEIEFYSFLIGIAVFMIGGFRYERQLKRAKRYVSSLETIKP